MADDLLSPTLAAIYKSYEDGENRSPRAYLGASSLGAECRRALWYQFRWVMAVKHEGRILRLFETGQREEDRLIANLRAIGLQVEGEQYEVVFCEGHGGGHMDGAVLGLIEAPQTWHVLEGKTANKRRFDELYKKGPPPQHLAQMQIYMGGTGMTRALYLAQCKDDDRLFMERIKFDQAAHDALMLKARAIVYAEDPPEGISKDPAFWQCKWCDYAAICHGTARPAVNCRTCVHSEPTEGGKWDCRRELELVPGCAEHLFIPALVGEPLDGCMEWIEYADWINVGASGFPGKDKPHLTSEGWSAGRPADVDAAVGPVKRAFPGAVVQEEIPF